MLDFLTAIADFFGAIATFVQSVVKGLGFALAMIPQAFVLITYALGFLPSVLLVFAMAGLTICIIFHIIGR